MKKQERQILQKMIRKNLTLATHEKTSARMFGVLAAILTILSVASIAAATEEESATELARKTQSPVAELISVPFESDFNFNNGTRNATTYVLNVQPIIPFHLNKDWNLITRTILPIINEPSSFSTGGSAFGLGDINPSFFLSPAKSGAFMWGIGPTFTLPTATDSRLGSHRFSMGPAAAGLMIQGPWLAGVLVNNQWSVTGWGQHRPVNEMLLEPFVNYNFGNGWHLSTELIMTADWEARASQRWTVPVGGGVGKLSRLGKLPVDTTLEAFWNVEHPDYAADWQPRFRITFLLPAFKR